VTVAQILGGAPPAACWPGGIDPIGYRRSPSGGRAIPAAG